MVITKKWQQTEVAKLIDEGRIRADEVGILGLVENMGRRKEENDE